MLKVQTPKPVLGALSHASNFTTKVISGHGRGKLLGFPTLNLSIPNNLNFKFGIYAGWVTIGVKKYQGAFHYGPIPTFNQNRTSLEVFVLNQNFNKTPKKISFQLVKRLRSIKNFTSHQKLSQQIKKDVSLTKTILATTPKV